MDIFKENGLQKVLLPRTDIKPLMLLEYVDHGKVEIIGNISDLFLQDTFTLPIVIENISATEWAGSSTLDTQISANVSFLQGIWSRLGKGDLNTAYKSGDTVELYFKNLLKDAIDSEIKLHNYLRGSVLNNSVIGGYRNKLNRGELYIITYVLKSDDFEIKIIDKNSRTVKAETNIEQIVNANLNLGHSSDVSQTLKSIGQKMIVAVRVKKLFYDKGNWFREPVFELRDPGKMNVLNEGEFPTADLITPAGFITFDTGFEV
jgi:hypothetical protein